MPSKGMQLLVQHPTAPLAISSALWFSLLQVDLESREAPSRNFQSFAILQSILRSTLAVVLAYASNSPGLPFPTAHVGFEGPLVWQVSTPTFVSPSGFTNPLDDFLPSNPSGLFFNPAALMGFALRSLTCREVTQHYCRIEPTCRLIAA